MGACCDEKLIGSWIRDFNTIGKITGISKYYGFYNATFRLNKDTLWETTVPSDYLYIIYPTDEQILAWSLTVMKS